MCNQVHIIVGFLPVDLSWFAGEPWQHVGWWQDTPNYLRVTIELYHQPFHLGGEHHSPNPCDC